MKSFAYLALLPLVAGCNVHTNKSDGDSDNVSIHSDEGGNISFNLPFAKGQVKLPSSFMHSGKVDIDGVKLMPGSQLTGFNVDSHNDVSNVDMSFTAPQSPDAVRSYFVDEFKKQGVDVTTAGDTLTGKSKDGSPFTIVVGPAGTGSRGTINVQDKD